MKNNRRIIVGSLAFSIAIALLRFVSPAEAGTGNFISSATPTPSPAAIRSRIGTFLPSPTPTPSPSPMSAPSATPGQIQTLEELQSKIRQRMSVADVRRGRIGIKIVSLNSGKVIFENDADKYFMPASNMKNFTVSTALEKLGPDFKFVTSVYAAAPPDSSGTVRGGLRILGRGDVSMSTAFDPAFPEQTNYYRAIDMLIDKIAAAGVKRVEGDLIADETYFRGFAIPGSWEWDDLGTYSGAEVSAFPLNDNVVDVSIKPSSAGKPCDVAVQPATPLIKIINNCLTTSDGGKKISVNRSLYSNEIEVAGTFQQNEKEVRESVTFTHMAELFAALLKERLEKRGIQISGKASTFSKSSNPERIISKDTILDTAVNNSFEIAKMESPTLGIIAAKTMKPSQNMYTETILWTLGEVVGRPAGGTGDSSQLGINVVKNFLTSIGIPSDGIVQYDGSGLSRHDLITPEAVVALYTWMAKQSKNAQVWRDSLTIGGVDGTLKNRFKGTAAEGNIRGKTGTIDQVSALSGYMTTAAGEPVVLSIIVNGVPVTRTRTSLADDIVVSLANFKGKIDVLP